MKRPVKIQGSVDGIRGGVGYLGPGSYGISRANSYWLLQRKETHMVFFLGFMKQIKY